MATTVPDSDAESVDDFRARAHVWVQANLEVADPDGPPLTIDEAKRLQATIFDAGFAGIAMPRQYGGAGLTLEHQKVWAEEVGDRLVPSALQVSLGMMAPTLLDHASEALLDRHLARILRGDEVWIQLLSEPSGGSDMAGAMTSAVRDGDTWVLNGSKIWSTGAADADYGMCLARTNWDLPKHDGLSMFAVPLQEPTVSIVPIVGIDGGPVHFFQEFLDDVSIPLENLIGAENAGWSVAHSLLFHERNATAGVGHGLGLVGGTRSRESGAGIDDLVRAARRAGSLEDPVARQQLAAAFVAERAREHAADRVMTGMRLGTFKGDWGSLLKLGLGVDTLRRGQIGLLVGGADAVIWGNGSGGETGRFWLSARDISIAGGTNEMQRNIISERLLGMPREPASDRDVPFREVVSRRDRA